MKDIAEQTLSLYFKKMREPKLEELTINDESLKNTKGCCFVTLYINGEVHGSAGNIKEISPNIAEEIYINTLHALTKDKRFPPLTLTEAEKIKCRVDLIEGRKMISEAEMKKLDPVKFGVIAIKRDYEKLAVILPNISPKLLTGEDFVAVLLKKLNEKKFLEKDYIIYEITTKVESNY